MRARMPFLQLSVHILWSCTPHYAPSCIQHEAKRCRYCKSPCNQGTKYRDPEDARRFQVSRSKRRSCTRHQSRNLRTLVFYTLHKIRAPRVASGLFADKLHKEYHSRHPIHREATSVVLAFFLIGRRSGRRVAFLFYELLCFLFYELLRFMQSSFRVIAFDRQQTQFAIQDTSTLGWSHVCEHF